MMSRSEEFLLSQKQELEEKKQKLEKEKQKLEEELDKIQYSVIRWSRGEDDQYNGILYHGDPLSLLSEKQLKLRDLNNKISSVQNEIDALAAKKPAPVYIYGNASVKGKASSGDSNDQIGGSVLLLVWGVLCLPWSSIASGFKWGWNNLAVMSLAAVFAVGILVLIDDMAEAWLGRKSVIFLPAGGAVIIAVIIKFLYEWMTGVTLFSMKTVLRIGFALIFLDIFIVNILHFNFLKKRLRSHKAFFLTWIIILAALFFLAFWDKINRNAQNILQSLNSGLF